MIIVETTPAADAMEDTPAADAVEDGTAEAIIPKEEGEADLVEITTGQEDLIIDITSKEGQFMIGIPKVITW